MLAWSNQKFLAVPAGATVAQISPHLSFFETFAVRGGVVAGADEHEARLKSALRHQKIDFDKLHLNFTSKKKNWSSILVKLFSHEKIKDGVVRWIIIPGLNETVTEWVTVRALPPTPPQVDLFILKTPRDQSEWIPRPKAGPWLNSQTASEELKMISPRADIEGLQLDAAGNISDCTRSALAWFDGQNWLVTSSATQSLASTTRQQLMECLKNQNQTVISASQPFPTRAQSIIILRSTFDGGGVCVQRVYHSDHSLKWSAAADQSAAQKLLINLKSFRAQRSVSLL